MDNQIIIDNCNCITHGQIKITRNQLNIKLGPNGTGKSTIGHAIQAKLSENPIEGLSKLLPYGADRLNAAPYVSGLEGYSKAFVFNEKYASRFSIKSESLFENSFRVFLKSDECDQIADEISRRTQALTETFDTHSNYSEIYHLLLSVGGLLKMNGSNISRAGGLGEIIRGKGYGFDNRPELNSYKPYYTGDFTKVSKWADWRRNGNTILLGNHICPYCAGDMDLEKIDVQNKSIEDVFKNSAIKTANQLIIFFEHIVENNIANEEFITRIKENLGNSAKEDELFLDLSKLGQETEYLTKKIERLLRFKPSNIDKDALGNIAETLSSMKIDVDHYLDFYKTQRICELSNIVNSQIDSLMVKTGELKGLFLKYENKLSKLISERMNDINDFFILAGFPYEFCIVSNGNETASTFLRPVSGSIEKVDAVGQHLSWGELNAFSLVMFMFEAVSSNADLIILDDPISSFDTSKKFAIIQRLFSNNQEVSFRNRTVLILTHDFQPLLDYVRSKLRTNYGVIMDVNASFLRNTDGVLNEVAVEAEDLKSIIKITKELACDANMPKACRIVNLRKHIECTETDIENSMSYHVLSNLVHGNSTPSFMDGTELSLSEFTRGCNEIKEFLTDFDYNLWLDELSQNNLMLNFGNADVYNKVLIARFLIERNKDIGREMRKIHPGLCKFLHQSNHIENDFIFQLDPRKFYYLPPDYELELNNFISNKFS